MIVVGVVLEDLDHLLPLQWLVIICIKTNLLAPLLNLGSPFACQSHNWYIQVQLVLDNLGCREAVHDRHFQIHDNKTVNIGLPS